ncbi:MAG TPA: 16S rRNA (cytidine(1402)-2'-O)-methyltransferase [Candidatus Limnocylindrales bacterium]|nr:16S rRNA (cytidine(1402)-2'-O)-methyltransferase [Candidatus Limnocylindrales bacterium]
MPGKLYVVATPIGNMADLSPRAAGVLREVDIIAAEDTRVTGRLLERMQAPASTVGPEARSQRMLSYREETERKLAPALVARMQKGESVALVSDAGTPGVSDPGYRLVSAAAAAGIEVVAVPGPSAVVALLSISGLPTDRFSYEGFPPAKASARRRLFESLRGAGRTVVFYESPRRVKAFLEELAATLDDPVVAVGRELTKMYEQVLRGRASEVAAGMAAGAPRGEFTIAVHVAAGEQELSGDALESEVTALLEAGMPARDIAAALKPRGAHRRDVYDVIRRLERK